VKRSVFLSAEQHEQRMNWEKFSLLYAEEKDSVILVIKPLKTHRSKIAGNYRKLKKTVVACAISH
jgi:hypothetical protein